MQLRQLTDKEIKALSERNYVRGHAVQNFLSTMGSDHKIAYQNLNLDRKLYKWNLPTTLAISDGIMYATTKPKGVKK